MTFSAQMNKEYGLSHLEESDLNPNPFKQFESWLEDAIASGILQANAMSLATVDKEGKVSVRMMACQAVDDTGFQFVSHYNADKGHAIEEHPQASILFWWPALERQVNISGIIEKMSHQASDAYFEKQDPESQLTIAISKQGQILKDKETFINEYEKARDEIDVAQLAISRPSHWGGFVLKPTQFEFWQGGMHNLHDRLSYRKSEAGVWEVVRLYP